MKILDLLREETVIANLQGNTKDQILDEMAQVLSSRVREIDTERLRETIQEREKLGSTVLNEGVAIPHGRLDGITKPYGVFARSVEGVECGAPDGKPTHLFFLLVAPENSAAAHLKALARVSCLLKDPSFRKRILILDGKAEIFAAIREKDNRLS
jgi:PTS system nitrogen regulatory IIA component